MNDFYIKEKRSFESEILIDKYCGMQNPDLSFNKLETILTQEFDAVCDTIEHLGKYVSEAIIYYFNRTIDVETVTLGYFKNDGCYKIYYLPSDKLSRFRYIAGSKYHAVIFKLQEEKVVDFFHFGNCAWSASLDTLIHRFLKS